ncbi:DUF4062 domain-containing protein [Sphingomonas sp. So64.6b]|uniref:DUF4062 domain-containing protein n=1 Tax=Sphingomonas sp. So64.6b TaxID=2997354 RepID=UPI00160212AA|nr:DUF4062 domain-containing protein [Sphingomonas sp. So64.6b]QNA84454.1 DUF4062 domain-containing protein [Sphingomonas sp. So64.6b]
MAKRPTFFLSSTIYDFEDLRGAIKYLLESRGCRVLASEYRDFNNNLDQHSYEACLSNIDQADYFILLIGGRVGGWYDEPSRISITQQEYRHAYARHEAGSLRIVTLVRDQVWQLREDRKALAKHLASLEMNDQERREIVNFHSRFTTDAEFVSAFITEVGRNLETAMAVKRGTEKPTGNWIHTFRNFRDIADVLHPLTFGGLTADEAAYRKALQHELLNILCHLLLKYKGEALDPRASLIKHLNAYAVTMSTRTEDVYMEGKEWDKFATIFYQLLNGQIEITILPDALTSSIFLQFDPASGGYRKTAAYGAISRLIEEVRRFNKTAANESLATVFEYSPRNRGGKDIPVEIPATKILILHHLALRWINIITLCESLIRHLEGNPFAEPNLAPYSPIRGMDEEIERETVTHDDARRYLKL